MMAPSDSRTVSHSRSPMTSVTGRPYSNERPKSPLATIAEPFPVLHPQRLVQAVGEAHGIRLGGRDRRARGGGLCGVGGDEIDRRQVQDGEGHQRDRQDGDRRQHQPPGEVGQHVKLPSTAAKRAISAWGSCLGAAHQGAAPPTKDAPPPARGWGGLHDGWRRRHALKYQVSGWELPGVRQCWALQTRAAILPSLLETRRTPRPAGDWPTVPMPYCWSTRIFQISCAFLLRPSAFRPAASV